MMIVIMICIICERLDGGGPRLRGVALEAGGRLVDGGLVAERRHL